MYVQFPEYKHDIRWWYRHKAYLYKQTIEFQFYSESGVKVVSFQVMLLGLGDLSQWGAMLEIDLRLTEGLRIDFRWLRAI